VGARVSDDRSHSSRDSGGLGTAASATATAVGAAPLTQSAESREQVIARRRAAQHRWRAAREGVERAALRLHEASRPPGFPSAAARQRLEHAEHGERQARRSYYHVAKETGALLSRLAHGVGRA
jgi:hypothetical protein